MADTIVNSRSTYAGGIRGFAYGAVAGALVAALGSFAMAYLNAGEGGPGLATAAGAAFGGGIGLLWGAIRSSRTASR
jgi:hypothetical protein